MFHDVVATDSWSSLVINEVVSPAGEVTGYILVIDRNKRDPLWKLAAGHNENNETPLETAMRENQGETGLRLPADAYEELPDHHEWRTRPSEHWSLLFKATVREDQVGLINPYDQGNEGEEVKYFTLTELGELISTRGILESHLNKMIKAGCTLS